ncbi:MULTISPECIES: hypothetical protein [Paenibacillus]|uniref:hypothetical protein n=1 Tax=Paenibacillus TaxID=44249 RepID=UPI0022B9350C|nr:hypothetical protein [Paenibacillus caseinilyticus]MCZ8521665.1 hypothetical protein [Paenibacillus caseinilyticus]
MNHRFEPSTVLLCGTGELTDEYVIELAIMVDRLNAQLEIAGKALQSIAEVTASTHDAARDIAVEALQAIK